MGRIWREQEKPGRIRNVKQGMWREDKNERGEGRGCCPQALCCRSPAASADCRLEAFAVSGEGTLTGGSGPLHTLV